MSKKEAAVYVADAFDALAAELEHTFDGCGLTDAQREMMSYASEATRAKARMWRTQSVDPSTPRVRWKIQVKWEPRDLWVGLYWTRERNDTTRNLWAVYVCLVPCFPIVIKQYVRY